MKMRQRDKFQHAAVVDKRRDTEMREVDLVKTTQYHCLQQEDHSSNMSSAALWHPPKNREY